MRLLIVILLSAMTATLIASPVAAQGGQTAGYATTTVNVRECPRLDCARLGTLAAGQKFFFDGYSEDRAWISFQYWNVTAWVSAQYVRVGDQSPAGAFYTLISYSFDPPIPAPGVPFRALINIAAADDHETSVAVQWPSSFYMTPVQFRAGTPTIVTLENPGQAATGPHRAMVMLDVEEKPRQDGRIEITYFVDRPSSRSMLSVPDATNINLGAGAPDVAISAGGFQALGAAKIDATDTAWTAIHYDLITPAGTAVTLYKPPPAAGPGDGKTAHTVLLLTNENKRAVLRVLSADGNVYTVEVRSYE